MALIDGGSTEPEVSRRGAIIATQTVLVAFAALVYGLRIYTRHFILRSIGADDYIMAAAVVMSIALTVTACIGSNFGWGQHLSNIPYANFGPLLLFSWLSELLFTAAASLLKLSILVFYLRVAVSKIYRVIIYCTIGVVLGYMITFTFLIIFQCSPVNSYWDPTATNCINPHIPLMLHGIINNVADFWVFILPMPMVWKLQLHKRQRLALVGVFGVGFVACVLGALRLHYSIATQDSNDSPWVGYYFWSFQCAEVNVGIACASLPPLKQLIARHLPGFVTSSSGQSQSSHPHRGQSKPYIGVNTNSNTRPGVGAKHVYINMDEIPTSSSEAEKWGVDVER